MADEIIEELWRIKDEIAREHNYDLAALVAHLRDRRRREGEVMVDPKTLWRRGDKKVPPELSP